MEHVRLAARLYNVPLLLTLAKAQVIEQVFRTYSESDSAWPSTGAAPGASIRDVHRNPIAPDFAGPNGARMTQSGYFVTTDGIAIVPIVGTLVQRTGGMDADSGLVSYERIGAMLVAANADYSVRGIVLDIDSAGGEAAGVAETAKAIRASAKPVTAVANEAAFSAAYWLASAADSLIVPETGLVGSVGVILMHVDQSIRDGRLGLKYTPIFAGAHKDAFSPHEPLTDSDRAFAQGHVDRLYEQFVAAVAGFRGIDADKVRATEAGLLHPEAAIAAGMADRVGTLSDAVAQLRVDMNSGDRRKSWQSRAAAESSSMALGAERDQDMTDSTKVAPIAAEQLANERAAGFNEGSTTGKAEGTKAERDRVAAILGHAEAKGRETMAKHIAFATAMNVEDAVAMLAAAPKEKTAPANPLAAAMATVGNPQIGAGGEPVAPSAPSVNHANVYAFRAKCMAEAKR